MAARSIDHHKSDCCCKACLGRSKGSSRLISVRLDPDIAEWIYQVGGTQFIKHALVKLKELQKNSDFQDWWLQFVGEHSLDFDYLTRNQLEKLESGLGTESILAEQVGELFRVERAQLRRLESGVPYEDILKGDEIDSEC
jgi:hypothetical protein